MMNLLARILSHGFAFAVVALIVIVLLYRGEFPELGTPEFLVIDGQPEATEKSDSGTIERITDAAKQAPVSSIVRPPTSVASPVPVAVPDASGETQSGNEIPAAEKETSAETVSSPVTDEQPAAETIDVDEPAADIETSAVPENAPVAMDASSSPAPAGREESATQTTVDITAPSGNETADEGSIPVEPAQPATNVDSSDDVTVQATDDATTDLATDEPGTMTTDEPTTADYDSSDEDILQAPGDTSAATDDMAVDETETTVTAVETTSVPVMDEVAPAEVTAAAIEAPATAAHEEPAIEPPAVTPDATVQEKPYEVMAKAREAFWLRDFELAEQQYRKLTQLEPDNPDGFGEMGNMYFSQGKWDESATAYYEAGVRLLNEGLVQEARQMVDVIRGLNSPRAGDLEAQIDAAESASAP